MFRFRDRKLGYLKCSCKSSLLSKVSLQNTQLNSFFVFMVFTKLKQIVQPKHNNNTSNHICHFLFEYFTTFDTRTTQY